MKKGHAIEPRTYSSRYKNKQQFFPLLTDVRRHHSVDSTIPNRHVTGKWIDRAQGAAPTDGQGLDG